MRETDLTAIAAYLWQKSISSMTTSTDDADTIELYIEKTKDNPPIFQREGHLSHVKNKDTP